MTHNLCLTEFKDGYLAPSPPGAGAGDPPTTLITLRPIENGEVAQYERQDLVFKARQLSGEDARVSSPPTFS